MAIKKWAELNKRIEEKILSTFERLVKAEDLQPDLALSIVNLDYCPYQPTNPLYNRWQTTARKIKKSKKHLEIYSKVKERTSV